MADTVTSQTIADVSGQKTTMKFTNISDGSGEAEGEGEGEGLGLG